MWDILIPIIVGVVCGAGGWFGGYWYRRNIAEAKVAKAEDAVKQMIDAAQKRAETIKKKRYWKQKKKFISSRAKTNAKTGNAVTKYSAASAGFCRRKSCWTKDRGYRAARRKRRKEAEGD